MLLYVLMVEKRLTITGKLPSVTLLTSLNIGESSLGIQSCSRSSVLILTRFVHLPALWPSGPSVAAVHRQQRRGAAQRPSGLSDQQPRAASDRAAVRERPEPAGARRERRPAVLPGLHSEHTDGAAHHQHSEGGEEEEEEETGSAPCTSQKVVVNEATCCRDAAVTHFM